MRRKILVPIDVSESSLTQRIIPQVELQARDDDAEVHFLTVIPTYPYIAAFGQAFIAELPSMESLREDAETRLKEIVKQFSLPPDRVTLHSREGSPKDMILSMAKSLPADLIIIASHQPDITTYLLGSNAAAVVRHAECSVMVVR